jgi:hypothetical protein
MKLNIKALTIASALFTGGMMLLISMGEIIFDGYGMALLLLADSIYPGYTYGGGWSSVAIGTLYAMLDGAIGGALFGWLYNVFAQRITKSTA